MINPSRRTRHARKAIAVDEAVAAEEDPEVVAEAEVVDEVVDSRHMRSCETRLESSES